MRLRIISCIAICEFLLLEVGSSHAAPTETPASAAEKPPLPEKTKANPEKPLIPPEKSKTTGERPGPTGEKQAPPPEKAKSATEKPTSNQEKVKINSEKGNGRTGDKSSIAGEKGHHNGEKGPAPLELRQRFGVGIALGSANGISLFYSKNPANFYQAQISFNARRAQIVLDYNKLVPNFLDNFYSIHAYYGVGGLVSSEVGLGARIPLGITWQHAEHPLQLSAELAPGMFIIPETRANLDASIIVRYMFGKL